MAKYTCEIDSRHIYSGPEERSVSELFELNASVEFGDDSESDNDFDIELKSDGSRFKEDVAYNTDKTVLTNQKGTSIAGTRTSDTRFTRTAGTWTASALLGYRVWAENTAVATSGMWIDISSNTTTSLVVDGTLPTGCDQISLQAKPDIRHNIQIIPLPGFYGSFFKYKVTKKVPSDGNFKWFNVTANAVLTNIDPEFIAKTGNSLTG